MKRVWVFLVSIFLMCGNSSIGKVNVSSFLVVRNSPDPSATIVGKLYNDSLVCIIEEDAKEYVIEGVSGHYCLIKYTASINDIVYGYVFSAYLDREKSNHAIVIFIVIITLILTGFIFVWKRKHICDIFKKFNFNKKKTAKRSSNKKKTKSNNMMLLKSLKYLLVVFLFLDLPPVLRTQS